MPSTAKMTKLFIFFDSIVPFPKRNNETYVTCINNMDVDCKFSYGRYDANTEAYSLLLFRLLLIIKKVYTIELKLRLR